MFSVRQQYHFFPEASARYTFTTSQYISSSNGSFTAIADARIPNMMTRLSMNGNYKQPSKLRSFHFNSRHHVLIFWGDRPFVILSPRQPARVSNRRDAALMGDAVDKIGVFSAPRLNAPPAVSKRPPKDANAEDEFSESGHGAITVISIRGPSPSSHRFSIKRMATPSSRLNRASMALLAKLSTSGLCRCG